MLPSATETTHSRLVVNHNSLSCNFQLYTLGHSPICVTEVKKSLENYPYKDIACEFIKGLNFGFPLNYSGPRSPITSKNLKSVADMPELAKQQNFKSISNGKNCWAIFSPPFFSQLYVFLGLLNFACQVVAPGRAFSRRLINATCYDVR